MKLSKEEIELRIEKSHAKYNKLKEQRDLEKINKKSAKKWLKDNNAYVQYGMTIPNTLYKNALSIAAVLETDGEYTIVKGAYALKNPNDTFSKTKACMLLANRLQNLNECLSFKIAVPNKLVNNKIKLVKFLRKIFVENICLYSEETQMPRWLLKDFFWDV